MTEENREERETMDNTTLCNLHKLVCQVPLSGGLLQYGYFQNNSWKSIIKIYRNQNIY